MHYVIEAFIVSTLVPTLKTRAPEILKLIIANFKAIHNWLKSVGVIRPIKSINTGNYSHLMIKKASCHLHIVIACSKSMFSGIISLINITD